MNSREDELRTDLTSKEEWVVLKAGIELAVDFLIPRNDLVEAETTLLEVIGLQVHSDGFIVQLRLAELYLRMNEVSRAMRFLNIARTSNQDLVKSKAEELLTSIEDK